MTTEAVSTRASVMIAPETTFGTEVARTKSLPALSTGLTAQEGHHVSGAMRKDVADLVATPGLHQGGGSLAIEPNGVEIGDVLKHLAPRSDPGGAADIPGQIAAAPSLQVNGVGTLASGAYIVSVAACYTRTGHKARFYGRSPSSNAFSVNGSQGLQSTWSAPASNPANWTLDGYLVGRTAAGGAAGTEKAIKYISAPTTTWTDDGSTALSDVSMPDRVFQHVFDNGSNDDPDSFSLEVANDNGFADLYLGCHIDGATFTADAEGGPVQSSFEIIARQLVNEATPTTPSFAQVAPFMGFRGTLEVGEDLNNLAAVPEARSFELRISNGYQRRFNQGGPSATGGRVARVHKKTRSRAELTLGLDYELDAYLNVVLDNTEQAVRWSCEWPFSGEKITSGDIAGIPGGEAYPVPYFLAFVLPKVPLTSHSAPASGDSEIVQSITSPAALKDLTAGYSWRIVLWNKQQTDY